MIKLRNGRENPVIIDIIRIGNQLTLELTHVERLHELIGGLFKTGKRNIIINMSNVDHIERDVVACMIIKFASWKSKQVTLCTHGIQSTLKCGVLKNTVFFSVLTEFESEREALEYFAKPVPQ